MKCALGLFSTLLCTTLATASVEADETQMTLTLLTVPPEGREHFLPGEPIEGIVHITLPKGSPPPRRLLARINTLQECAMVPYELLAKQTSSEGNQVCYRYAVPLFFRRAEGSESKGVGLLFPTSGEHRVQIVVQRSGEATPPVGLSIGALDSQTEKKAFADYEKLFEVPRLLWFREAPLVREERIAQFLADHPHSAYAPVVRLAQAFHKLNEIEHRHPTTKAGFLQQRKDRANLAACFEQVLQTPSNSYVRRRAMFHVGRMLFWGEKYVAAQEILKQFTTSFPSGPYAQEAKKGLAELKELTHQR